MTKLSQNKTVAKSQMQVGQSLQLGQITEQGQYVNRQTGVLLVVDPQVAGSINVGGNLFGRFITSEEQASLNEFVLVSQNPHQAFDETRIESAKLNLPISF